MCGNPMQANRRTRKYCSDRCRQAAHRKIAATAAWRRVAAGAQAAVSTREERRQARIARLLNNVQRAAAEWAEAEYQEGVETGRFGIVSARVNKLRERAKGDFVITIARLSAAVSRPIADKPAQHRLRLR